jgi:hypothetical protein
VAKHYPRSHYYQQEHEEQSKGKGWYCKEHDTKYLCEICGYDSSSGVLHKQKEEKYYFVSG